MTDSTDCPKCGAPLSSDAPSGLCASCLLEIGLNSEPSANRGPDPEAAAIAKHFPNLEVLELVGKGGMGTVYKAHQKQLDRMVAVKILRIAGSRDPAFAERFLREAQTLAKLNHPNIVQVFDFGEVDDFYYFVMEYVDGPNLRQVMDAGRLEPSQALDIVPCICAALQYAHNNGVVHRDIKPENVLIDQQGLVKIADFGLAKLLDQDESETNLTRDNQVMGTPHYMAPEQLKGSRSIDHRADIYSLGVVLYELLTGELPVGQFELPSKSIQVDVRLDQVVLRSLASNPDRRYQHASDVQRDVERISIVPTTQQQTSHHEPEEGRNRSPLTTTSTPTFSNKALIGGCWASLFFLAVAWFGWLHFSAENGRASETGNRGSVEQSGSQPATAERSPWIDIVSTVFGLLGATAPIGTTALGLAAISELRHSRGQMVGLPLAVADSLLFPLLIMNAIVLSPLLYVLIQTSNARIFVLMILCFLILILAPINFFIARYVWKRSVAED